MERKIPIWIKINPNSTNIVGEYPKFNFLTKEGHILVFLFYNLIIYHFFWLNCKLYSKLLKIILEEEIRTIRR